MKYFDNCATTTVDDEVITAMNKIHKELFFNPSSLSASALQAKNLIEDSREIVAKCIGAQKSEILFTSGGSESNNTAIFGSLRNNKGKIITSKTEHASVFYTLNEMKNRGFDIVYAPLNGDGSVKTEKFEDLIDDETRLVALMHVNNETGAINDIAELCKKTKAKNKNCLFLCDGVQAFCKVPVNVKNLDVDFYSMSAHKIHGPKGIGALYIKNGVKISPLIFGGGQENNLRSGTENVAGIVGFGVAAKNANALIEDNFNKYVAFKTILKDTISNIVDNFIEISSNNSSPNIFSLAFKNIKSEVLMRFLEAEGFIVGNGSACSSKSKLNRISQAINLPQEYAEGIIRICFCKYNTEDEVIQLANSLASNVQRLTKLMGFTK